MRLLQRQADNLSRYTGRSPVIAGPAGPNFLRQWHAHRRCHSSDPVVLEPVQGRESIDLQAPNPNYIGNFLGAGLGVPLGVLAPNYKTPVSVQMNIGIQHQIRHGMVFSADYLRNVETRSLLGVDINHQGTSSTSTWPARRLRSRPPTHRLVVVQPWIVRLPREQRWRITLATA